MKKLLYSTNLGWIEGKFTSNYIFSDISTKCEEAYGKEWVKLKGSGYPEYFIVILEHNGKIIKRIKRKMKPSLFTKDGLLANARIVHIKWLKCSIDLHYYDFDNANTEYFFGTFRAYLYENEIESFLNIK